MADEAVYTKNLCDIQEIKAPDDLVQGDVETGTVYVSGAGEYERGEVLMSDGQNRFVKATESGMQTAKELCILSEDISLEDENTLAVSTGYFFGRYNPERIILPEGMAMDTNTAVILRRHGIYMK